MVRSPLSYFVALAIAWSSVVLGHTFSETTDPPVLADQAFALELDPMVFTGDWCHADVANLPTIGITDVSVIPVTTPESQTAYAMVPLPPALASAAVLGGAWIILRGTRHLCRSWNR